MAIAMMKTASVLFRVLLNEDDIVSHYQCKKLVHGSPSFVRTNLTVYMDENSAAALLYIAINFGTLTYQYLYASWFLYFLTTRSGLKKLYNVVFKNQILGVFFFASFYFRILEGSSDESKFNQLATALYLPKHADFVGQTFLTDLVDRVPYTILGHDIYGYRNVTKMVLKIVAGSLIATQVENIGARVSINDTLARVLKDREYASTMNDLNEAAVLVDENDELSKTEIAEYLDYIEKNRKSMERDVKKETKNKKKRKIALQRIIEMVDDSGHPVCLNECKERIKTAMGCYCDGECGKSLFGNYSWCYVDALKCKRGKVLPKYNGNAYDRCGKKEKEKTCYTGYRWLKCNR